MRSGVCRRAALGALVLFAVGACGAEGAPSEDSEGSATAELEKGQGPSCATPDAGASPRGDVTYTEHVRPILARACVSCHSPGAVAPFALDSYAQAKSFAPQIAQATRARTMPPSAIDNSGQCNTFRDVPWLTDAEIALLERWSAAGAPEGDPTLPAPTPHALPKLVGEIKTIKTPPYVPKKGQKDDYRCFVLKSPFTEKTFVTGFDTRPGDKETAHHMVVFYPMDNSAAALGLLRDALDPGPGYTCFGSPGVPATMLAAWTPGGGATRYPDKVGLEVVPNRPLIVQMHYSTMDTDMPHEDSTQIDFEVQKEGISPGAYVTLLDLEMSLAPGQKSAEEVVTARFPENMSKKATPVEVYGVYPHMHQLGKTLRVTAASPAGAETCMADVPRYDFQWQRLYFFDKPIAVDPSTSFSVRCNFDTTSRMEVTKWGESTHDEMCVAGLFVKL